MKAPYNVIWVLGDQHRGQALGCAGDPNACTPNIDALAATGLVFDRAMTNCPLCSPARGTLLTSLYPHECVPAHESPLPPDAETIAHAFARAGYDTAYFGKWHLDGFAERSGRAAFHVVPPERRGGFSTWLGYENNNSQWDSWVHGAARDGEPDRPPERLDGYETDVLTDRLIAYLREKAQAQAASVGKPFFAVLSVQPPHNPYVAPAEDMLRHRAANLVLRQNVPNVPWVMEKCRRDLAGYYAMIESLDRNLGRIRAALRAMQIDGRTLVIFFSDHGDMHGSHGQFLKQLPYEESIRVPCILGGIDIYDLASGFIGGRLRHPFSLADLAPTTLGLCGIAAPASMRGFDFSGHCLKGRTAGKPPDSVLLQYPHPFGYSDTCDGSWRGIVTDDGWKYVEYRDQPWLMFELNQDPFEEVNLAILPKYRATRKRLRERLAQWRREVGDDWAPRTLPD